MIFDKYPYTNFHEMNDDWVIQTLCEFGKRLDEFVAVNSLTYADPIGYDPDTTYPANTVLIYNSTAYLTKVAAPAGVLPTNGDYYLQIFPFGDLIQRMVVEGVDAGVDEISERVDTYVQTELGNVPVLVNQWMNEHPEITTPIPDESVLFPKLNRALREILLINYHDVSVQTVIPNTDFVQGGIDYLTGEDLAATNACRTDFITFPEKCVVVLRTIDQIVMVYKYTADGQFVGRILSDVDDQWNAFASDTGYKFRFTIANEDLSDLTPEDLPAAGIFYFVYSNLADVSELKRTLTLGNSGKMTISGSFSYGVFNNNFPVADPRKFNAVMMQSEQYDRDVTITAKPGYNFLAYWYDENDNYVGKTAQWVTSRTIRANTPFRLWVRESPFDTSVILDLTVVKNNIVFNTPQQDEIDKNIIDIALNTTNVNLNGHGLQQIDADFVWGTMNTSTGAVVVENAYKYQVVMPTAVHYDRDVTIKCNSGYRYQVWWYSAEDEYISRTGGFKTSTEEYVVTAGTYFRLFITLDPPNNQTTVDPSVFIANVFLVTELAERVNSIAVQPLSTLPEYIVNSLSCKPVGSLSKGYILLTCDDGTEGLATYTIPMLIDKGVPATFGLLNTSPVITNDTYLSTVLDAINNHGCCVAQHGFAQWPTYAEKALNAYFDATETLFNSKGITEIHGAICPGGAGIDTNTLVKAIAGGRFGSVFSGGLQDELKYGNYNEVGPRTNQYAMARYSALGFTTATYRAAIDEAYENHYILCPFWHDYSVVDDTEKQAIIEGMIDYAKTKGLTFITMADLPYIT